MRFIPSGSNEILSVCLLFSFFAMCIILHIHPAPTFELTIVLTWRKIKIPGKPVGPSVFTIYTLNESRYSASLLCGHVDTFDVFDKARFPHVNISLFVFATIPTEPQSHAECGMEVVAVAKQKLLHLCFLCVHSRLVVFVFSFCRRILMFDVRWLILSKPNFWISAHSIARGTL